MQWQTLNGLCLIEFLPCSTTRRLLILIRQAVNISRGWAWSTRNSGAVRLRKNCFRAGVEYQVRDALNYRRYAVWLLSVGKKDEALQIIKKAISLEPDKTREYITLMILNNLSDAEILSSLPDRVLPHQIFADYLSKTGADRMAEEEYLNSLRYLGNESSVNPSYFNQVIQYYMRKGRHEEALEIVKKAMEVLPDDAGNQGPRWGNI